jgi:hypothetical protein
MGSSLAHMQAPPAAPAPPRPRPTRRICRAPPSRRRPDPHSPPTCPHPDPAGAYGVHVQHTGGVYGDPYGSGYGYGYGGAYPEYDGPTLVPAGAEDSLEASSPAPVDLASALVAANTTSVSLVMDASATAQKAAAAAASGAARGGAAAAAIGGAALLAALLAL